MTDSCGDNRFKVIQAAKKKLIESTNITDSPDEMKVIDNFLFRCWQMGWLRCFEPTEATEDGKSLVHAHWIHDFELYYGMHNSYHCSKCGRIIRIVVPETLEDYPYCHCGAKMDSDENE